MRHIQTLGNDNKDAILDCESGFHQSEDKRKLNCHKPGTSYIGYTMRHLRERVEEHKHKQSSICKHYMSKHGTILRDLTENITVLRKCNGKFECLLYEMLFIQKEKPPLNIQSDSLRAKLFMQINILYIHSFKFQN